MNKLRTPCRYLINAVLAAVLLVSCEGSIAWREKRGLIKEFDSDFVINSIRVDDDGEFHIVAVSPSGNVKTMHDADIPYDIKIKYSNETKQPILRVHYSDRNQAGKYYEVGIPEAILPINYKIETFND